MFQLSDIVGIIGKTPDTAINKPHVLTADFEQARFNAMMPPVPSIVKTPDQMVGDGTERSRKLRKGWWTPVQIPIGGRLNTHIAARLGSRCLGGARSVVPVTAGHSYDNIALTQTKSLGRNQVLSTMAFLLGGYDFLIPSLGVQTFSITFNEERDVDFSATLINTGYNLRLDDVALMGLDIGAVGGGAPPTYHLMH